MPTTSIIRPDGLDVDNANWVASVGLKYNCVNDTSDSTYVYTLTPIEAITFTLGAPAVASNVPVTQLVLKARVSLDNTGEIGLRARFNSVDVNQVRNNYTTETSRTTVEVSYDLTFLRPGGGQWTVGDIGNLNAGIHETNWSGGTEVRVLDLWVEYSYAEVPLQTPAAREVASRILRRRRTTTEKVSGIVPPEFLDLELLTDFGLVHQDAAAEGGQGYQFAREKRGVFRLMATELDMNDPLGDGFKVTLEGDSLRDYAVNLWDAAHAKNAGVLQDGCALLDGGQVRTFDRNTEVRVEDPSDGRVVTVLTDNEALTTHGRLIEREAKNYLPASSFRDGATGYTDGNNANVSKTTVEYADWTEGEVFDPQVTRFYTLFEVLNNANYGYRLWPATAVIPANTTVCVSLDVRYEPFDSGGFWALFRDTNPAWWDDAGQTWVAGMVRNPLGGGYFTPSRQVPSAIPIGGTASTLELLVGMDIGATVGAKMRLYHVQIEAGSTGGASDGRTWASSRIVTPAAAAGTRAAATLAYENNSGNRIWPASGGTLFVKVRPTWASILLSSGDTPTAIYCYHDANNNAWLYYDQTNGRWAFSVRVGGVTYTAFKNGAPSAVVSLGARWTSSVGEYGLAAYTVSIFVNGAKGTDAVASGPMTEAASSSLSIGHKNGAAWLDGALKDLQITPLILSDAEIVRLGQ
jgi:hypothetical protein